MSEAGVSSYHSVISEAAGVADVDDLLRRLNIIQTPETLSCFIFAGNLFAFVLFLSPIPTFKRIIRNKSTEQFSGLPYICSLSNSLICLLYGLPIVSTGLFLIATVSSVGAIFQLVYVFIFIIYAADRRRRLKMLGLLLGVFAVFAVVVFVSLRVFESPNRHLFVGYVSVFSLISMFASPLFIINLVIRTKSVEYMPFYLSLATFLTSLSFFAYGMLKHDAFVSIPNGIGAILGVLQLVLYIYYSKSYAGGSMRPLLETYT